MEQILDLKEANIALQQKKLELRLKEEDKEVKMFKLQMKKNIQDLLQLEQLLNMKCELFKRRKQLIDEGHTLSDVDEVIPKSFYHDFECQLRNK